MKAIAIFIIFVFLSCSKKHHLITGRYSNYKFSTFSAFLSNNSYTMGESLIVNKDSSFIYQNCSIKYGGDWKVKNDSLLLYFYEISFRIDSLNYLEEYQFARIIDSSKPYVFKMKNQHLINDSKRIGKRKIITDLIKID